MTFSAFVSTVIKFLLFTFLMLQITKMSKKLFWLPSALLACHCSGIFLVLLSTACWILFWSAIQIVRMVTLLFSSYWFIFVFWVWLSSSLEVLLQSYRRTLSIFHVIFFQRFVLSSSYLSPEAIKVTLSNGSPIFLGINTHEHLVIKFFVLFDSRILWQFIYYRQHCHWSHRKFDLSLVW